MNALHEHLAAKVTEWRAAGYPAREYPAVAEILEWARDLEHGHLRFLRAPQLRALEVYWYLRLVERTPHVFELYQRLFPRSRELRSALGLTADRIRDLVEDEGIEVLWTRIRTDDDFVRDFRLEALRETLTLAYPSYILALAMGAGKTILIGAIVAPEFAMAMEDPEGPFVQNALVFAPGKTIIESFRELLEVPYERILPPRMHKPFAASVKLTFTRDGEKDLPVVRGSLFNVVVTNTEKIRIQRETVRRGDLGPLLDARREDEARAEVANLRLQAIASLPHLAVFSDEAHHTYGQSLGTELKKVRKTVDYLATRTNLIVVVNTTGTPYFERQPLRDVVIWYGLAEGIRDGILKDVAGNIQAYDFDDDARAYVRHVVRDFFAEYGAVQLPNGAASKLAIYFPQTDDVRELRPVVDEALASMGYAPALCLVNTSDPALMATHLSAEMRQCIDECLHCYATCEATMTHCLQMDGRHAEATHMRIMDDCAKLCALSADFMLRGSDLHVRLCGMCADVCRRCAESCERVDAGDDVMRECAAQCRSCVDACDRMARAA